MVRESAVYGAAMATIVIGLAVLLLGVAQSNDTLLFGGGLVGLVGVGVYTLYVASLPEPHHG